jgi:hypothetical protein
MTISSATSLKANTFAHVAPTFPAPTTVTFDIIVLFFIEFAFIYKQGLKSTAKIQSIADYGNISLIKYSIKILEETAYFKSITTYG